MMDVTNFIDSELLYHLEYGKLYLFVSSDHQAQAYTHLLKSSLRHSINLGWLAKMEVVTVHVPEVNRLGMVIAARKVNAGNIGRYSVLACVIQSMHTLDDGLFTFYNRLTSVEEDRDGDNSTFTLIFPEIGLAAGESASSKFLSRENRDYNRERKFRNKRNLIMDCICAPEAGKCAENPTPIEDGNAEKFTLTDEYGVGKFKLTKEEDAQIEILREDVQENDYAQSLQQQRNHDLQLIQALIMDFIQKYHADPTELIATSLQGKYVVNTMPMLVVNRDRKIIFPEYNEMELKMSAASRTLYIWFLFHPEGCRLKELSNHRAEFIDIYEEVHPGSNYVEESVDALLKPDKLNQNLSRIKKMVRSIIINDDIAHNYFISRDDDGTYRLPIATHPHKIRLPKISQQVNESTSQQV